MTQREITVDLFTGTSTDIQIIWDRLRRNGVEWPIDYLYQLCLLPHSKRISFIIQNQLCLCVCLSSKVLTQNSIDILTFFEKSSVRKSLHELMIMWEIFSLLKDPFSLGASIPKKHNYKFSVPVLLSEQEKLTQFQNKLVRAFSGHSNLLFYTDPALKAIQQQLKMIEIQKFKKSLHGWSQGFSDITMYDLYNDLNRFDKLGISLCSLFVCILFAKFRPSFNWFLYFQQ